MTNKCREEFEKWFRKNYNHPPAGTADAYISSIASNHWVAWNAAWEAAKTPSPAPREGWLTHDKIEDIRVALFNWQPVPPDEIGKALDMATAAISLSVAQVALLRTLRAAIETIERGNV